MKVLVPELPDAAWRVHLRTLVDQTPLRPFAPDVLDFIHQISQHILLDKSLRRFPELISLGYWMRRPALEQIRQEMAHRIRSSVQLPRGVVLHFAPSNVDSIFVYSWFLSVLAGNANIIRLSDRRGDQVNVLLKTINQTLSAQAYKSVRDRTLIVSYDHDAEITQELSGHCQVRVIWGGDETIRRIRAIPLNPLATELAFADRFSSAVLNAAAVLAAGEKVFAELVHHFCNDTFWFDQMACSSPRLIIWVGRRDQVFAAKERFWPGIEAHLKKIDYRLPAAIRLRRMTTAYYCASEMENVSISEPDSALLTRVGLPHLGPHLREMHCGGGLFFEMEFRALQEITAILTAKDQTLTVYGFSAAELADLAQNLPKRSIDRIVPVGQALTFSHTWDGINLFGTFTREISVIGQDTASSAA